MIDQIERVFHFLRSLQGEPNHAEQAREALRDFVKICDTLEDARQHLVMIMRCLKDRNEFMPKAAESELADEANLYDEVSEHSRRLIRDTLTDPPHGHSNNTL
jgi:enamine deaminase RidA (YjgF/YER057c/UK114 family)